MQKALYDKEGHREETEVGMDNSGDEENGSIR